MPIKWWPIATPSSSRLRAPTEGELATWKNGPDRFPNIKDVKVYTDTHIIPGERQYNCFAWSLGFQDRWVDGGTRDEMVKLFSTSLSDGSKSTSSRTFSSSSSLSQRPVSSKGYKKAPRMDPWAPVPAPSSAAVASAKALYDKLNATSSGLVEDFNMKFDAWKKTWFKNNNSPNSATRAEGHEFNALLALGPKIVPLVVYRLTNPDNFMAVVLYDKLETDFSYKVDPKDISNYKVLQRRTNLISTARIIVDLNLQRNVDVEDALRSWAELRERRSVFGNSNMFTDGDGYYTLTEMGPSIISHVMLEYYKDQSGWYHELLHHLVHGKVSGSGMFFKQVLFESWKDWFEHKDHKDAPEGPDARARMGHGYTKNDIPS
ncbi:hypothetical protein VSDG_03026 [Cytospora chrysosperma]|uniref:Uncharacterized protein n=1 Tax=Cytospora chrysosperma TaxID=252740 RepID=A0A423W8Q0_CYTCH|nr:hypothetical protein VSDG_03026 [Valsa sordida]